MSNRNKIYRIEQDLLDCDKSKIEQLWSYPDGLGQERRSPAYSRSDCRVIRALQIDAILWHSLYGCFVFEFKSSNAGLSKGEKQSKRNLNFMQLIAPREVPVYSAVVVGRDSCGYSTGRCRCVLHSVRRLDAQRSVLSVHCVLHQNATAPNSFLEAMLDDNPPTVTSTSMDKHTRFLAALIALRSIVYLRRDVPKLLNVDAVDRRRGFRAVDDTIKRQFFTSKSFEMSGKLESICLTKQQLECLGGP